MMLFLLLLLQVSLEWTATDKSGNSGAQQFTAVSTVITICKKLRTALSTLITKQVITNGRDITCCDSHMLLLSISADHTGLADVLFADLLQQTV
jgi:hypothetical protein